MFLCLTTEWVQLIEFIHLLILNWSTIQLLSLSDKRNYLNLTLSLLLTWFYVVLIKDNPISYKAVSYHIVEGWLRLYCPKINKYNSSLKLEFLHFTFFLVIYYVFHCDWLFYIIRLSRFYWINIFQKRSRHSETQYLNQLIL